MSPSPSLWQHYFELICCEHRDSHCGANLVKAGMLQSFPAFILEVCSFVKCCGVFCTFSHGALCGIFVFWTSVLVSSLCYKCRRPRALAAHCTAGLLLPSWARALLFSHPRRDLPPAGGSVCMVSVDTWCVCVWCVCA